MPNYKTTSILAGSLAVVLGLTLLFAQGIIYALFGMEPHASADIIAKRTAALFASFAAIALVGRNEPDTPMRRAVAIGACTMMGLLVATGLYEFARGAVGPGIFLAIGIEVILFVMYLRFCRENGRL